MIPCSRNIWSIVVIQDKPRLTPVNGKAMLILDLRGDTLSRYKSTLGSKSRVMSKGEVPLLLQFEKAMSIILISHTIGYM